MLSRVVDLMDLDDPLTSCNDLYGQSSQIDLEMAFADDWRYNEGDVEMGGEILAEPEVVHEVHYEPCSPTPMTLDDSVSFLWEEMGSSLPNIAVYSSEWSVNLSMPDIPTTLDALVDTSVDHSLTVETSGYQTYPEVHKTQHEEVVEPISLQARTTEIQSALASMAIPPLHPQLLMGDMSTFVQQISTIVNTLNSLTSLELEAQTVAALQTTATQLVSAVNMQPMPHGRVLQISDSKALAYEFMETAQSEDIDANIHSAHLPDKRTKSNNRGGSRGPTRHGWQSIVNNTSFLPTAEKRRSRT